MQLKQDVYNKLFLILFKLFPHMAIDHIDYIEVIGIKFLLRLLRYIFIKKKH